MAHGFLTPQDVSGESPIFGKIAKWLEDKWNEEREYQKKEKEEVSSKLEDLEKAVEVNVRDVTKRQAPAYKMLGGNEPKALPSGTKALPPGGPRLPGSPDGPTKGGAITSLSGDGGGISADTFFNRAQSGVGASGEYLTNAQRREAFIKSRQEAVKTTAATNAPAISPDSGADIVAAVAKNTEAISTLVKVTKEQTSNDTKLSERSALTQEKLMGRQRAAAEERSLEEGKDMSGFLTPTMKKIEQQAKGGAGGGGMSRYDANMDRMTRAQEMLDIGSDIADMRKGKVRRITQGRDGRTPRQRLRDMQARRPGGGVKPRGKLGALSRLGGAASKGGALSGLGGGLKGAARGLGKSGPLALLTAGLEFGDRMSSGQNAFQAGAGTAGSVGGGLAGAAAGAAIGSIVPGVGTVIGGLIGGMLGSMAGGGTADMLTGANNIPSGAGGMLSSGPMSGYMSMLHGTELTLSGNNKKETKNIGEALGEGMIMASLGPLNPKVLELSAKGMRHFYENMGGKDMMASIFEGVTDALGAVGNMLGSVANSLLGGAAHAGTMPGGTFVGGGGNAEQNLAAFASVLEGGSGQNAADAMQVMLNRAANAKAGGSMKAYGSTLGDQVMGQAQFSPISAVLYDGSTGDPDADRVYGSLRAKLGNTVDERKRKLLEIAGQGLPALQQFFGKGNANEAQKVLSDFQSGGQLSAASQAGVKGRLFFKGQTQLKNMKSGDFYRNTGGNFFHGDASGTIGKLSEVSSMTMGAGPQGGATGQANVGGTGAIFPFPGMFKRTHAKGWRPETGSYHAGQDIVETPEGGKYRSNPRTPILAAHDGIVSQMNYNGQKDAYLAGVRIWHPALGKELRYLHMNPSVKPGDQVKRGQVIGSLVPIASKDDPYGNTHLHLEFYDKDSASVREDSNQLYDQLVGNSTKVGMNQIASAGMQGPPTSTIPLLGASTANPPNLPAPATVAPLTAAAPAAANTGTGVMQASAQTSGPVFQQPVTVINNYNVAGQGGGGDVIPNTLGAGVSMDQMGLGSFSQLKLRSLG